MSPPSSAVDVPLGLSIEEEEAYYPDSDGQPMGENDEHRDWIIFLISNLERVFAPRRHEVYVSGDLFWYPVEGRRDIVQAPDAMVVFGRPGTRRRSYRQWREEGLAPQAVFEVQSPDNRKRHMEAKHLFYQTYGVAEYYMYDPFRGQLEVYVRSGQRLEPAELGTQRRYESPLLGLTFWLEGKDLRVMDSTGAPFITPLEQARIASAERERAMHEHERAEREARNALSAQQELEQLKARLRAAGINPDEV